MFYLLLEIFGAAFLALLGYLYYDYKRIQSYLNPWMKTVPGLPIVGNAWDFTSSSEFLPTFDRYVKEFGKTVNIYILNRPFILTMDHRLVEFTLGTTKMMDKSQDYDFLHRWLGSGLLTAKGQKWKPRRKIITPAFHFSVLEQFVEIFDRNGRILVEKLAKEVDKTNVNIYPFITLAALDIICETAMGVSVNAQENTDSDYVRAVKEVCRILVVRVFSPIKMFDFPYQFTEDFRSETASVNILHKYTTTVIQQRIQELKNQTPQTQTSEDSLGIKKKKAFLDLILEATIDGKPLSEEDIREEVDTFMFEGHDTTASGMSFILYCLAQNPKAQAKAFEEQKEIFGEDFNRPTTHRDIQSMKYLDNVVKESLRLYPSVPFYARNVTENIDFDGKTIPKGVTMTIYAYGMNRSSEFYSDPNSFNPDRYDTVDAKNAYSYLSFSAGPRNCIGQKFAMLEMKCTVAKVLRAFELLPSSPDLAPILAAETVLKSANGVNIRLKKR